MFGYTESEMTDEDYRRMGYIDKADYERNCPYEGRRHQSRLKSEDTSTLPQAGSNADKMDY